MMTVCDALEEAGYECWHARHADDALARLVRETRSPNVMLLDLKMPGMSVARFLSQVKRREDWAKIAVVLMTALEEGEIPDGLPVDAVLLKPFDLDVLLATVWQVAGHNPEPPRNAAA